MIGRACVRTPAPWRLLVVAAMVVAATITMTSVAHAWLPDGSPVCTATGHQQWTAIAPDGAGGAIIAWQDPRSGNLDIYAQRLDGNGNPLWTADGVVVCNDPNVQLYPSVCTDGSNGAIIGWQDNRSGDFDIYCQRLDGSGLPVAGWPSNGRRISTSTKSEANCQVVPDGAGGAIVVWILSFTPGIDEDIYAHHVLADGTVSLTWPNGGEVLSGLVGNQNFFEADQDGAGGAVVAWEDSRPGVVGTSDIYGIRVLGSGAIATGWAAHGNVICDAAGAQSGFVAVSHDNTGGLIAAWKDFRDGTDSDIYVQKMSAAGVALWAGNGVRVSDPNSTSDVPDVVTDPFTSGAYVAWRSNFPAAEWVQRLSVTGTVEAGWPTLGLLVYQTVFDLWMIHASATDNGVLLTWEGGESPSYLDILGQYVSADGRKAHRAGGARICTAPGYQDQSQMTRVRTLFEGGIVAWTDDRVDQADTDAFDDIYAYGFKSPGNLDATWAPGGHDYPVVPQNAPAASPGNVHVTPTLDGNQSTTYLTYTTFVEASLEYPDVRTDLVLDSGTALASFVQDPGAGGIGIYHENLGPFTVRGGRHTVEIQADILDALPESDEDDNDESRQFVWSPLVVSSATPLVRATPPPVGLGPLPNCDGFQYTRPASYAWVIGLAPTRAGDDHDLYCFDDYVGSESGFSNLIGSSAFANQSTDFVVGHYFGTPTTVYPAAVFFANTAGGTVLIDANNATDRNGAEQAAWSDQLLASDRLVDVYEANLTAGVAYRFSLQRVSGTSDLRFAIFPAALGGVYGRLGALANSSGGPVDDTVSVTAPQTGWYPIVVYRGTGVDANTAATYNFIWASSALVSVEDETPPASLAFATPRPNPAGASTLLEFELPNDGPVRLGIYDLAGRRVRDVLAGHRAAGRHAITWDVRDMHGRRVQAGVYWAKLEAEGRQIVRRVVVTP